MIIITPAQFQKICTHAESTYPEECCGLLLGKLRHGDKILVEVRASENSWTPEHSEFLTFPGQGGTKRNHFLIAPQFMLQVQKEVRDRNLTIIGIYHSHPDHPPFPSEFDRAIAWPQYSYVIVGVKQGKAVEIRSWELEENHSFQEETISRSSLS